MKTAAHWVIPSVCFLVPFVAYAQVANTQTTTSSTCSLQASQEAIDGMGKLGATPEDTLLQHLQTQLPACQNNVAWLVWAGQTLMRAGQYLLASDYLERALMLEPDNKGAKLDYALSLAGSEQPDAALSLVRGLLQEPDMPDHLRGAIKTLLARLEVPTKTWLSSWTANANSSTAANGSAHRFYGGVKVGRDSNLLGAPNLTELSLNFSGIPFSLSLDSSYLSQSGNYARADIGWSYTQPAPSEGGEGGEGLFGSKGQLQAWAQARGRESSITPEAQQQQAIAGAEYRLKPFSVTSTSFYALDQVGTYANTQAVELRGGTSVKYAAQSVGFGFFKAASVQGAQCEAKVGAEFQKRDLVSNPILSGRYEGLSAQWFCQAEAGGAWLLAASSGSDKNTDPARAGGPQTETAARAMVKVGSVLLELEADYKKDSSVYSVLLSDSVRKIARLGSRIEWQGTLAQFPQVQAQAGLQWSYQKSNLQLFRQQNWGPYIGLSRAW